MTTEKEQTLQAALTRCNPNEIMDALRVVNLGMKMAVIKATFVGLTSAAAQDITTAAAKAAATIAGVTLATGENLPAIGKVITLRVTAGSASAAARQVTDAGGTASTSLALLSDDGKTLTFEAALTAFILTYEPRAAVALSTAFGTAGV